MTDDERLTLGRQIQQIDEELKQLDLRRIELESHKNALWKQLKQPVDDSAHERWPERCASIGPKPERYRCGDWKDHIGPHTALIPTGAPWFYAGA